MNLVYIENLYKRNVTIKEHICTENMNKKSLSFFLHSILIHFETHVIQIIFEWMSF